MSHFHGSKRISRGVRNINGGYFDPSKKGVLQSFKFDLTPPEVEYESEEVEHIYGGYSVGDNDIIFDVKVITTTDELSVELIRVSQKHSVVHVVQCDAVTDLDLVESYHNEHGPMLPLNFEPVTFKRREELPSMYASECWPRDDDDYKRTRRRSYWEDNMVQQPPISVSGSILYEDAPMKMQMHISTLLNNDENSDVQICVGEEKKIFVAHKCILSARSSFFQAMFSVSTGMRESVEKVVNLPEDSPKLFEQVLHFIYTDTCPSQISEMALDLLILADKYDVKGLSQHCEEEIMKTLTTENVCDYLLKSEVVNAKELYHKCYFFILRNRKIVAKTNGWKKLKEKVDSHKFLTDFIKQVEKKK